MYIYGMCFGLKGPLLGTLKPKYILYRYMGPGGNKVSGRFFVYLTTLRGP